MESHLISVSEPPLQVTRKLRNLDPPITQRNGEVSVQLGNLKKQLAETKIFFFLTTQYFTVHMSYIKYIVYTTLKQRKLENKKIRLN